MPTEKESDYSHMHTRARATTKHKHTYRAHLVVNIHLVAVFFHAADDVDEEEEDEDEGCVDAEEDVCVADAEDGGSKRLERSKNEDWGNVDRFSSAMRRSGCVDGVLLLLLLLLCSELWFEGDGEAEPEADEAKG